MNNDLEKFFSLEENSDLTFTNKNKSDYKAFREEQKLINERMSNREKTRTVEERKSNLKRWVSELPEIWRSAVLTKINNPAALEARKIIKKNKLSSFYIQGESGSGKTYLGYAIIRRFIGQGWILPSAIRIVTEEELMSIASSGFSARPLLEELFKSKYKLYFFEGVGQRVSFSERESYMWAQMINHIYSNGLHAIFTSNVNPEIFGETLTSSSESKVFNLIDGKIIHIQGIRNSDQDSKSSGRSETEKLHEFND